MSKGMKKNGFTLIELLVTIVLMLTILGIAIVSFISISNRKKQEAWQQVISQIETAAKEYFVSNEYLFESLSNEVSGTISVGKLVEEDYLNNVVNPVTGKLVSNCAIVNVKKNENKYSASFDENSISDSKDSCDSSDKIVVSEAGAPKIENIDITNLEGMGHSGSWYQGGAIFTLNYSTAGNGEIIEILRCNSTSGNCQPNNKVDIVENPSYSYDLSNEKSNIDATVCYSVTNSSNKTAKQCVTANVDNTNPVCHVSASNSKWTNKPVTVTGTCFDDGSGCSSNVSKTFESESNSANGTYVSPGIVTDKVGNSSNCDEITIFIDKTPPTIDLHYDNYSANCISFKNIEGSNVQYKNTVGITDNISGIASTDYNYKYDGEWKNIQYGQNTIAYPRVNTAVLQRSGSALKYIYQSYNFLENKDSTFKIKACDNAGNCTDYKQKKYSAKSSTTFKQYCRNKFPASNSKLINNYTKKCANDTDINCWLTEDK